MYDTDEWVDGYLKKSSWKVHENSNVSYSFSGLFLRMGGNVIENYTLDKVYPQKISRAHRNGDIHIHNLPFGIVGYCAGWSLRQLLLEGLNGVPGKVESAPARHFDSALMQIVNFMGTLQNEWAGAMAINSLDTFLAPFIARDRLSYKRIKQDMQKFIFNLNATSRWGGQTLFTNITFDLSTPKDLSNEPTIIGGKVQEDTFSDFKDEMKLINKAFLEILLKGDMHGRPFSFPIPTYNITKDFNWTDEISDLLFKVTAKYGLPYFSNFVNTDMDPEDIRSMCCHLRLDLRELRRNVTGGLFGSGEMTGSVGVVTLNMPRLGYLSKNETEFYERLDKLLIIAKDSLEIKRKIVLDGMNKGLIPYSKRYLGTLKFHFSTIGLVGMNEACLNLFGEDISTKHGKRFSVNVLKYILKRLSEFQEETGNMYNLEATPAEGSSYRLALIDKQKYPKIITASKEVPRYTNSTWLPVDKTSDVVWAMKHQEALQSLYTGGTVFHTFLGEKCDPESCKLFVKKAMENTKLPYITITPTYSICPEHGYLSGEHKTCPICNKKTEIYSRVVGYFKPVANWNTGKKQEFKERKVYDESAV